MSGGVGVMLALCSEIFIFGGLWKQQQGTQKVLFLEESLSFPAKRVAAWLTKPWTAYDSYQDFKIPSEFLARLKAP